MSKPTPNTETTEMVALRARLALVEKQLAESNRELTALIRWAAAADHEPDILLTEWQQDRDRADRAEEAFTICKHELDLARGHIPDGYKLMPIKADEAMLEAACMYEWEGRAVPDEIWQTMANAAPTLDAAEQRASSDVKVKDNG